MNRNQEERISRYQTDVETMKKTRQELVNAQSLFGLDVTSYPELSFLEKDLKGLEVLSFDNFCQILSFLLILPEKMNQNIFFT